MIHDMAYQMMNMTRCDVLKIAKTKKVTFNLIVNYNLHYELLPADREKSGHLADLHRCIRVKNKTNILYANLTAIIMLGYPLPKHRIRAASRYRAISVV